MAGDWIKMRSNLWDDPRIAKLCDITDQSEAAIVGGLYWLWATADQHSEDGLMHGLTLRAIDRKTGIPGFGEALVVAGWLADHPEGVRIVRFNEHNGESAKKRCQTAKRVANFKAKNAQETAGSDNGNALSVTKTFAERDLEEEEEEEEEKEPSTSLSSGAPEQKNFEPVAPTRKGHVCGLLRKSGMSDAAPHYLTDEVWEQILAKRTNEEIVEVAKAKMAAKPNERIGLKYIAKALLDDPAPITANARASPRMSHADKSKLAAARAIFGTEIEGTGNAESNRIIDITPAARPALGG